MGRHAAIENKLKKYLGSTIAGGPEVEISNFAGVAFGASRETFLFDLVWEEGGEKKKRGLVLRRDPPTGLLDHISRQTEYRILKCLEGSGIPAPRAVCCETDPAILERPFIIMERVDGLVTQAFQVIGRGNAELRQGLSEDFVAILARIHNLDWRAAGLDFLGEPQGPLDYARRETAKWEGIIAEVKQEPDLVLAEALVWLKAHLPPTRETCLVHGDYKTDNVMYKGGRIQAIFDWEMAGLGDPHDDLGWVCAGYYQVEGLLCGLMEREWFLDRYQELSGREVDPEALRFWQVFSNLKMAAITLTGAQRYLSGAARKNTLAVLPLLLPKIHRDLIELLEL